MIELWSIYELERKIKFKISNSFRIAKVKQMLSLDADAIKEYGQLLATNPDYVPALLGE